MSLVKSLTPRHLEIAQKIAEGKSNKVIAYELGISEGTVKQTLYHAFNRMKVNNRSQFVFQVFIKGIFAALLCATLNAQPTYNALSWTASSSASSPPTNYTCCQYNVYRSANSGPYVNVCSLVSALFCNDNVVSVATSYSYVVTAVATSTLTPPAPNLESNYSTAVVVNEPAYPSVYNSLYTQLQGDLTAFTLVVPGSVISNPYWGCFLSAASANNGPGLLNSSTFTTVQAEVGKCKAYGSNLVSIEISFPMLDNAFLSTVNAGLCSPSNCEAAFTTFYTNVIAYVKSQGMKVLIESQSLIPSGINAGWGSSLTTFYSSLNWTQYMAARASTAAIVAALNPDFFVLQEEPDTEAFQSGQNNAANPTDSVAMLNGSMSAVAAVGAFTGKVGAGFGTWIPTYQTFANAFTQTSCGGSQPCITNPLDFMDLHIFPLLQTPVNCFPSVLCPGGANFQTWTMAAVSTAVAASVKLSVSQCWLRKATDAEWFEISLPATPSGTQPVSSIEEGRDQYGFWSTLDQSFLQLMYQLGRAEGMYFVLPFNIYNMYSYLSWTTNTNNIFDDCGTWPTPSSCGTINASTTFSSNYNASTTSTTLTPTGVYWKALITNFTTPVITAVTIIGEQVK
jgi:DNA-binding CsgD family transcriptional regulator